MWHSTMSVLTWKPKVTPRNRLLFQLAVSKHPTKEIESGSSESLWPTPRATERMGYYEQPSPSMIKGTHGWSLPAAVTDEASEKSHRMWPTPTTQEIEHPDAQLTETGRRLSKDGKNSHSLGLADQVKMWPTPTTMDTKEDSLKHATKMLQGKTHRSSGQPIQKTLADKVMMEEIIKNPELMELYQDHQMMERPHLPEQQEFVAYLRSQTTMKELAEKTDIKKTTIEHWFRKDTKGFSHPSIEDWEAIKPHLKELKYDEEITTVKSIEWENQKMWPTPNSSPATASQTVEATQKLQSRDRKQGQLMEAVVDRMWPTPNASDNRDRGNLSDPAIQRRIAMGKQVGLTMAVKDQPGKGTLNPNWVEWLMGYPPGWTDISDSSENPTSQE